MCSVRESAHHSTILLNDNLRWEVTSQINLYSTPTEDSFKRGAARSNSAAVNCSAYLFDANSGFDKTGLQASPAPRWIRFSSHRRRRNDLGWDQSAMATGTMSYARMRGYLKAGAQGKS